MLLSRLFSRHPQPASRRAPLPSSAPEALEQRIAPANLIGLTTTNLLVTFDSDNPVKLLSSVKVSGLAAGEDLVSIDSRAANGVLYGLTNKNTLYTVNPYSGAAKALTPGAADFPLTGKFTAIDFNPAVDRLRVVTDGDQNFRINPISGVIVDGDGVSGGTQPDTALAFAASDPNNGKTPTITATAYDRNFQGTTQTTLYGIDSTLNALVMIGSVNGTPNSPNGGQVVTVGPLGVDPGANVGFEIADDGTAYAAMQVKGKVKLYTINLSTGAATEVGLIGKGSAKLDAVTSLPREEIVFGVTASNRLVSFRADDPGHLKSVLPLRGLLVGEKVTDIDFRPASGELFGLTSTNRIVIIDTATGKTTQAGAPLVTSPQFTAGSIGDIDFNPTVDRLRLVNAADNNLRFNPLTYAPVDSDANAGNGNTPDTSLAYIATDANVGADPNIVGSAYDRNDNAVATATTLWGIDSSLNALVRQGAVDGNAADVAGGGSPNGGQLTTIGSLGVDVTDQVGFDIIDQGAQGTGVALAVMQINGETTSKLFSINLNSPTTNQPTGGATLIGTVAGGEVITAMAIAPPTIEFAAPTVIVKEKAGTSAVIDIKRTGGHGSTASVQFFTFDGTATAGLDYTEVLALTVTFAPGETHKRISIPILGDKLTDPNETVGLSLANVIGGNTILGDLATATLIVK